MPTVLREAGFRIVIYTTDHDPPHVHVFGDGETKIALGDASTPPERMRTIDVAPAESRRALRIVREHQAYLIRRWNDIHG